MRTNDDIYKSTFTQYILTIIIIGAFYIMSTNNKINHKNEIKEYMDCKFEELRDEVIDQGISTKSWVKFHDDNAQLVADFDSVVRDVKYLRRIVYK